MALHRPGHLPVERFVALAPGGPAEDGAGTEGDARERSRVFAVARLGGARFGCLARPIRGVLRAFTRTACPLARLVLHGVHVVAHSPIEPRDARRQPLTLAFDV